MLASCSIEKRKEFNATHRLMKFEGIQKQLLVALLRSK
jgi:hypothetical protein